METIAGAGDRGDEGAAGGLETGIFQALASYNVWMQNPSLDTEQLVNTYLYLLFANEWKYGVFGAWCQSSLKPHLTFLKWV